MSRLPPPIVADKSGTNLYGGVPDGGVNRQNLLNKMLTGGKKGKKGGAPLQGSTLNQGSILVPNHNATPQTNTIQTNLVKISNQGVADRAHDNKVGGRRKKPKSRKKTKKTKKRRNTRKVVRK